ncbi:MAG: T9SS type A sorting domain-containing protein [Saprospiraceae bacterium]
MKSFTLLLIAIFLTLNLSAQEIAVPQVQKVLMTKKTASWCPPCGSWAWNVFETLLDEADENTIVLAAHYSTSNDVLTTTTGTELINNFEQTFSRPAFLVNNEVEAGSSSNALSKIRDAIDEAATVAPMAQTGIQATYAPNSRIIDIATRTQFFADTEGEYQLGVYLVKKSMISYQASIGNDADHKRVLRDALTEDIFGELVASENISANTSINQQFTFELAEEDEFSNLEILTLLWKKVEDKFELVNTNLTDEITEAVVNNLDETTAQAGFSITPNVVKNVADIQLNLVEKADINLSVFNANGQLVQTIQRGAVAAGAQHFAFAKNDLSTGLYFVRLRIGQQVWNRKMIIQ